MPWWDDRGINHLFIQQCPHNLPMHLHWAGKQFSPYPAITISLFCSWGYPWRKEHFKAAKQSKWWTEKVLSYLGIDGKSLDYWKVFEGPPLLCDQWSDQCPLGPVLLVWSGHITPLPRSIFPRIRVVGLVGDYPDANPSLVPGDGEHMCCHLIDSDNTLANTFVTFL